jgi:hypothetical protein
MKVEPLLERLALGGNEVRISTLDPWVRPIPQSRTATLYVVLHQVGMTVRWCAR